MSSYLQTQQKQPHGRRVVFLWFALFLFSIKIVEVKREKNSTQLTDSPLREKHEEPRRLRNINESWRETRLWVGGWGPSGAPLRVAGLRCMLIRVHCVSKLAGPCCGVSYCHAHHQVEPLLPFGRHCAVDRDQHVLACKYDVHDVTLATAHPAHHRRAHVGRAQHVAGRDQCPTDCREKFGPTQPVTGSNFNGHVHSNIWTGEYLTLLPHPCRTSSGHLRCSCASGYDARCNASKDRRRDATSSLATVESRPS